MPELLEPPVRTATGTAYCERNSCSLTLQQKGGGVSYGLKHAVTADTTLATIPLGYADGVPRRLWGSGGEVLLGGKRVPIVGVVTMDQIVLDCGCDANVKIGDEVLSGAHLVPRAQKS